VAVLAGARRELAVVQVVVAGLTGLVGQVDVLRVLPVAMAVLASHVGVLTAQRVVRGVVVVVAEREGLDLHCVAVLAGTWRELTVVDVLVAVGAHVRGHRHEGPVLVAALAGHVAVLTVQREVGLQRVVVVEHRGGERQHRPVHVGVAGLARQQLGATLDRVVRVLVAGHAGLLESDEGAVFGVARVAGERLVGAV
jgi:hypothetical protein